MLQECTDLLMELKDMSIQTLSLEELERRRRLFRETKAKLNKGLAILDTMSSCQPCFSSLMERKDVKTIYVVEANRMKGMKEFTHNNLVFLYNFSDHIHYGRPFHRRDHHEWTLIHDMDWVSELTDSSLEHIGIIVGWIGRGVKLFGEMKGEFQLKSKILDKPDSRDSPDYDCIVEPGFTLGTFTTNVGLIGHRDEVNRFLSHIEVSAYYLIN